MEDFMPIDLAEGLVEAITAFLGRTVNDHDAVEKWIRALVAQGLSDPLATRWDALEPLSGWTTIAVERGEDGGCTIEASRVVGRLTTRRIVVAVTCGVGGAALVGAVVMQPDLPRPGADPNIYAWIGDDGDPMRVWTWLVDGESYELFIARVGSRTAVHAGELRRVLTAGTRVATKAKLSELEAHRRPNDRPAVLEDTDGTFVLTESAAERLVRTGGFDGFAPAFRYLSRALPASVLRAGTPDSRIG
jgi:hypothetical protein